jgi:hypothetical protein
MALEQDINSVVGGVSSILEGAGKIIDIFNPPGTGNNAIPQSTVPNQSGTAANNPPLLNIGTTVNLSGETKTILIFVGVAVLAVLFFK